MANPHRDRPGYVFVGAGGNPQGRLDVGGATLSGTATVAMCPTAHTHTIETLSRMALSVGVRSFASVLGSVLALGVGTAVIAPIVGTPPVTRQIPGLIERILGLETPAKVAVPRSSVGLTDSARIERFRRGDLSAAEERVAKDGAQSVLAFNHIQRTRHLIGTPARQRDWQGRSADDVYVYAVLRRPGYEREYRELIETTSGNLQLNEVYVSSSVSDLVLDKTLNQWADHCHTQRDTIKRHSSFGDPLTTKCRPGGICLVLSIGPCDQHTFDSFER